MGNRAQMPVKQRKLLLANTGNSASEEQSWEEQFKEVKRKTKAAVLVGKILLVSPLLDACN